MQVKNEMRRTPRQVLKAGTVLGYVKNNGSGASVVTGTVHDISTTGIGIIVNKHCESKSEISLHLCALSKAPVFKTSGKVIRCFKKGENQYLVGIEFDNIGDTLTSDVKNYVEQIKSSQKALARSLQ